MATLLSPVNVLPGQTITIPPLQWGPTAPAGSSIITMRGTPPGQVAVAAAAAPMCAPVVASAVPAVVEQSSATEVTATVEEEPPKKSKLWLWLLIGGGLLLLVGLGVYFYLRNKKRSKQQNQEIPYSNQELEALAQAQSDATSGFLTPVEAATQAAEAGGGDPETVRAAALAAEHITHSDVADEVNANLQDEVAVDVARHRMRTTGHL